MTRLHTIDYDQLDESVGGREYHRWKQRCRQRALRRLKVLHASEFRQLLHEEMAAAEADRPKP